MCYILLQISNVFSKKGAPSSATQFHCRILKTKWINLANLWSTLKGSSETLQQKFLKEKCLKSSDLKILEFWNSLSESLNRL